MCQIYYDDDEFNSVSVCDEISNMGKAIDVNSFNINFPLLI